MPFDLKINSKIFLEEKNTTFSLFEYINSFTLNISKHTVLSNYLSSRKFIDDEAFDEDIFEESVEDIDQDNNNNDDEKKKNQNWTKVWLRRQMMKIFLKISIKIL